LRGRDDADPADDRAQIIAAVREGAARADLVIVIAGSSAGRDDHTAAVVEEAGTLLVHGVAVKPGHPVVLGVVDGTPVLGAPAIPSPAALTFELFALPLLAALEGAAAVERPPRAGAARRRLASSLGSDDWIACRLGRVGGGPRRGAAAARRGRAHLARARDGLLIVPAAREGHDAGEEVEVRLLRDLDAVERTIVAIGSHDPCSISPPSLLRARDPAQTLVSGPGRLARRSRRAARRALPRRRLPPPRPGDRGVHAAVDPPRAGRAAGRRRPPRPPRAGPDRRAGQPGGRARARRPPAAALRQPPARGGHARAARPRARRAGIDAGAIDGYEREEPTHLAVAAAVAAGRADAGLGVLAAARAFGLDFVPVAREPFDLVMAPGEPAVAPLLALLADDGFKAQVEALGGYSVAETGRRIA
jgi:putative molybdopterin biosynthesis protein